MWQIIEGLAERHPDYFFYLTFPSKYADDKEQMEFLSRMPDRVKLISLDYQTHDRVEELFKVNDPMIRLLEPGMSPLWDFDVMLTSRIPQLQFLRNHTNREVSFGHGTYRGFFGLEEMPVFSFRESVSWAPGRRMDLQSLAAYRSADGIVINNLYVKDQIRRLSKEYLSPSTVLEIQNNIREAIPVRLQRLANNPKPIGKTANLCFAGRMTSTRNFQEVAELFRKHASFPLGKKGKEVKFIVSTHSLSTGALSTGEIDFIDVQKNTREQFYAFLKDTAHVVINLSPVEDFSLSTYEPLLYGVPVIVPDEEWTSFLGPDYPFRVKTHEAAYLMLKEFVVNYDVWYAKFIAWEQDWWAKLVASDRNVPTIDVVDGLISEFDAKVISYLDKSEGGEFYKKVIRAMNEDGLQQVDAMAYSNARGVFICPNVSWRNVPVGRRPNMYLMKRYMNLDGWQDTLEPGVFVKPSNKPKIKAKLKLKVT